MTRSSILGSGSCLNPPETISLDPINPDDGNEGLFIFASLRYDPILTKSPENTAASFNTPCPFYLLEHQWTRLQVANWCTSFYRKPDVAKESNGHASPSAFLHGLLNAVRQWHESNPTEHPESLRIKIRSYVAGHTTTEIWPLGRMPLSILFVSTLSTPEKLAEPEWNVTLDVQLTEATESTMYKTSDRSPYSRARARAAIATFTTPKEVLLYNAEDEILDGSLSTPYFYRQGRWVTPTNSCGGLQGTTRRWALENGLAVEDVVLKDSLTVGEIVWFSNAVKGFFYAKYVRREEVGAQPGDSEWRRIQDEMNNGPFTL